MPIEECKINYVHVTYCLPMRIVFHDIGISHNNKWLLDVMGSELEILAAVHWHNVKFDIFCDETEKGNRPPDY